MRNRKARARVATADNSGILLAAFAALVVLGAAALSLLG
jgi:hypothetical protein